jgi:hypothetical protein
LGKVVPQRPDFVVLMEAANDVGTLSAHGTYWAADSSLRLIESDRQGVAEAGRLLARSLIPYTSEFLQEAAKAVRGIFRSRPAHAQPAPDARAASGLARERAEAMARDYESSLRSFVRVAAAWGITPVLMTQVNVRPASEAEQRDVFINRERLAGVVKGPEDFLSAHDRFNAVVRQVAASEGAVLVDLAAARPWAFGDVYDAVHFTDRGSALVADIVAAVLKDRVAARAASTARPAPKP